ncbi:thioredoxin family protein [Mucilaginibacter sp. HMF5004]|uniref:thioredoxin family protein n=1 Tax=Mucilaginibacter rivuli TaxID=2857527 RepID=UPI001C5DB3CF|nr:thioredoxin domain-containing protein [Mucilaginibacter rivuli]MBW4891813.1 thioredoxin family protein [Mucilaginibacter rivuli]
MKNIVKALLITFMIFTLPFHGKAQTTAAVKNDQINFIEDAWNTALKKAAAENKYIFVDAYATWCGPCKMLKATTFKDKKVAEFFNKNFINVSMDMEKGIGPKLAAEWQMQAYPTLIIFNPKGKAVLGTVGFIKANELLKFGQQGLAKKI